MTDLERVELAARRVAAFLDKEGYVGRTPIVANLAAAGAFRLFADEICGIEKEKRKWEAEERNKNESV